MFWPKKCNEALRGIAYTEWSNKAVIDHNTETSTPIA